MRISSILATILWPASSQDAPVETWFGDDDFGKVRSNGFNHPGYPLSNLFDGNKHSTYISRIFPRFKGAYVEVDFDGPVIIEEIILTTRSNTIRARDRYLDLCVRLDGEKDECLDVTSPTAEMEIRLKPSHGFEF